MRIFLDAICGRFGWFGCPKWESWGNAYRWARAYDLVMRQGRTLDGIIMMKKGVNPR